MIRNRHRRWGIAFLLTAVAVAWIAIARSSLFGAGLASTLAFFGTLLIVAGKRPAETARKFRVDVTTSTERFGFSLLAFDEVGAIIHVARLLRDCGDRWSGVVTQITVTEE